MAPLNTGSSYHRLIGAIYLRETKGRLVNVTGDQAHEVEQNWSQIRDRILETEVADTTDLDWVDWSNGPVQIREFPVFIPNAQTSEIDSMNVRFGREFFVNTVFGFVSRGVPVECCLPAFPCKSPNPTKVGGTRPDRAEGIALRVLRNFLNEVKKVYEPGAKLLIISDGHVFSDCSTYNQLFSFDHTDKTCSVSVDDDRVTSYDEQLKVFYRNSIAPSNGRDQIEFRGLEEILFSHQDVAAKFEPEMIDEYDLQHPVPTRRDPVADLSRKIMMAMCGVDRDNFKDLVKQEDKKVLPLYRGHNRFVLEDSAFNPHCRTKSKSQRKKIASQVSEEMILVRIVRSLRRIMLTFSW